MRATFAILALLAACRQTPAAGTGSGSGSGSAIVPVLPAVPAVPAVPVVVARPPDAAVRCTADGGPLFESRDVRTMLAAQSGFSLAITSGGDVYTSDNLTIARWKLEVSPGACALHLDRGYGRGGKLEITITRNAEFDREIKLGACTRTPPHHRPTAHGACSWDWVLAAAPDGAVYMTDNVLGLYRIDRGELEPVCPDGGWRRFVFDPRGRAVGNLADEVNLATCAVTKLPWAAQWRWDGPSTLLAGLIGTEPIIDRGRMFRDVGTTSIEYGHRGSQQYGHRDSQNDDICQSAIAFACGSDLCFADSGCMKVSRFALDGTFRGAWTLESYSDPRPERMIASTRTSGGDLLMLTVYRHETGGVETMEDQREVWPALMPAAAFTP